LGLKTKALLIAVAMVCAAGPALAYSDATAGGSFTAVDYAWQANATAATTLTVAPGQTVTFGYPDGNTTHNVDFTGKQPSQCTGLTSYPRPKGWTAECTFDAAGSYPFVCDVHAEMQGTVVVAAPTPTATPTASGDPVATPGATATPAPGEEATTRPPSTPTPATLKVKLAPTQKGTRVRGSVTVEQAATRLEVTVKSGSKTVGSWRKTSTAKGTVAFSVALNAKARKALKAKRRLKLTVTVALTPPGGEPRTLRANAVVSL
jgi:plastocyanin